MRHHNTIRKFGRERGQRRALLAGLARSLILEGRIETTLARAKELRPLIEKLLTKARTPTLEGRRRAVSRVGKNAAKKLTDEIAPKHRERAGGYTRITRLGRRGGDAREMSVIEFINE